MRRFARSDAYRRVRLVTGAAFIALGGTIVARTLAVSGLSGPALPGCALGAAMLALGAFRFRDYFASRPRA
jgi:hypothetical protein